MTMKCNKNRPVIGIISAKHTTGSVLPGYLTTAHYPEEILQAGGTPILMPLTENLPDDYIDSLLNTCDGFLLPGGADFDSSWYGEEPLPELQAAYGTLSKETQESAMKFLPKILSSGKPVLGICLGIQAMNIAMGGTLYQDIPTQYPTTLCHANKAVIESDRWNSAHEVTLKEGSLIAEISGKTTLSVNSFHHQAIKEPAPGFTVTARAADGLIEAMEHESGLLLGVQWHPENLSHAGIPEAQAIFRWLVEAAGK